VCSRAVTRGSEPLRRGRRKRAAAEIRREHLNPKWGEARASNHAGAPVPG
jgi:hypothetical protein